MMILIRDGAVPFHPIIGISALSSCVVQLTERDEQIGWTRDTVLKHLTEHPTAENAAWLLSALGEAFEALQTDDLVTPQELEAPTPELIESLTTQGKEERKIHQQHAKNHAVKQVQVDAAWAELVGSHLYKSKRALTLASLLETRLAFRKAGLTEASAEQLAHALATGGEDFRKAVGRVVRQLKAVRVGINMMDVSICGALAPYSPLLGGKLVSMLLASPELRAAYAQRYGGMASVIASGMKGEPVRRKPGLVLLGTTGLFAGGSSQYNRVKIPASILGGAGEVRYIKLERETEYATFHISQATMEEMKFFMEQTSDGSSVNSIFGEGVNPKMRKISESFKAIGFPPDKLLKAGTPRAVYMIPLAHNFREYLQGRDEEPNFILSSDDPTEATEAIAEFWRKRWLAGRIHQPGVLDAKPPYAHLPHAPRSRSAPP